LSESMSSSSPMIFEISTETGKRSFCGVEQFTAEEGHICVPQWMLNNLNTKEGSVLQVRRVSLPKGTHLTLQPHTADFLQVPDAKAMLEWALPKFVALGVGDTVVVPFRDKKFVFNVLEVKPGRAIQIIDSDVNTFFAAPLTGEVPAKNFSTETTATFATDSTSTSISTSPDSQKKGETSGTLNDDNKVEGIDFKVCNNCWHRIPVAAFTMHTLSCSRMNWFCEECKEVVQKAKKEEHLKEYHAPIYCECGASMDKKKLRVHQQDECPKRIVTCSFCTLKMPYIERFEHEQKCGTQTEKCSKCHKYIQKRASVVHEVECQEELIKRETERHHNEEQMKRKRQFYNTAPKSEELMFCPICMQPFEDFDNLQVHMISDHVSSDEQSGGTKSEEKPSETPEASTYTDPNQIPIQSNGSDSNGSSSSNDVVPMEE